MPEKQGILISKTHKNTTREDLTLDSHRLLRLSRSLGITPSPPPPLHRYHLLILPVTPPPFSLPHPSLVCCEEKYHPTNNSQVHFSNPCVVPVILQGVAVDSSGEILHVVPTVQTPIFQGFQ